MRGGRGSVIDSAATRSARIDESDPRTRYTNENHIPAISIALSVLTPDFVRRRCQIFSAYDVARLRLPPILFGDTDGHIVPDSDPNSEVDLVAVTSCPAVAKFKL
jgi:hypothetical protein